MPRPNPTPRIEVMDALVALHPSDSGYTGFAGEGPAEPRSYLDELAHLSDDLVRKIMDGNPARLLNLAVAGT